jgi:hypothetical protein
LLFRLQSLWNLGTKNSSELTPPAYDWLVNALNEFCHSLGYQSQSHIATDGQSVSLGVEPDTPRQGRAGQSRAVAYCRQPASTVTLGIEPRWDPWPYICSVSILLFFPLLSLFLLW